jgi:hypothetical protein
MDENRVLIIEKKKNETKLDKLYEEPNINWLKSLLTDMNNGYPHIINNDNLKLKDNITLEIYSPRLYLALKIIELIINLINKKRKLKFSIEIYDTKKLLSWIKRNYPNVHNLLIYKKKSI